MRRRFPVSVDCFAEIIFEHQRQVDATGVFMVCTESTNGIAMNTSVFGFPNTLNGSIPSLVPHRMNAAIDAIRARLNITVVLFIKSPFLQIVEHGNVSVLQEFLILLSQTGRLLYPTT
jgi:hypothetical protein